MDQQRAAGLSENIRIQWILFLLISFGFLLAGSSVAQEHRTETEQLRIGTGPYSYTDKLREGLFPLVQYLSRELDRDVELIITKDYEELADRVREGDIDIGFFSSVLYVQLKQRYPQLKYLVTSQITQGGEKTPYHFSWIIAKKDSGITKVKHLRGKSFAFTNNHSSSGYIYPQMYFQWRGLVPDIFFDHIVFAGTHEKVTDMIAEGDVETGASYDANIWNAEERYGRVFRRIKKVGPILNPSFAASGQVDDALCEQLITALENIPPGILKKDLVYTGFERLSETRFAVVAELLKSIN
jgi:phosphonate transport system substrate-binding protein